MRRATPPNTSKFSLRRDKRSVVAVEFALVLPVFLTFLFILFEIAYGQFIQSVLESTLQITAYQVQTNQTVINANGNYPIDNSASGAAFIDNSLCPNAIAGLLGCHNIYVRIQEFNTSTCGDFYDATSGNLPVTGGQLQLGAYVGDSGDSNASGDIVGPTNCESTSSKGPGGTGGTDGNGFCNAQPSEYIVMSAVYVGSTFLYALLPGHAYKYAGKFVHAAFATSAFYTEGFTAPTMGVLPC